MQSDAVPGSEFAAFDPPLARAVVAVLRAEGLRAWLGTNRAQRNTRVFVDPADRDAALACLGRRMQDVQELAGRDRDDTPSQPATAAEEEGAAGERPLVMERFARAGLAVALLLAPLLVVTLASSRMPRGVAIAIVVAGVVALLAARRGSRS